MFFKKRKPEISSDHISDFPSSQLLFSEKRTLLFLFSYVSLIIFRDLFANHQKMLYTKKRLEQPINHYYIKSKNQKTKESYL